MVYPIIHKVLTILLVVQDFATIHSMDPDLLYSKIVYWDYLGILRISEYTPKI